MRFLILLEHPLASWAALLLSVLALLAFQAFSRVEEAKARSSLARALAAGRKKSDEMREQIEIMENRISEMEERTRLLVPPAPARSGLNYTKRAQAIRMFRRGEQPAQVSAALGTPESEMKLLLDVYRLGGA